jgi:putative membrane protein
MKKMYEKVFDSLIYIICYTLILILLSYIFKHTIQLDTGMFGLWAFFVSMTIYFLNKTVKPILFSLTLPITAMTLGIFYPFINVIILNIVDILYGSHFNINGIFMSFVVACLISILNVLTDQIIIQPLLRGDKHESDLI